MRLLDQEILYFIVNDPEGQMIGETHIANLKRDIERTKRSYNDVLNFIESMFKGQASDKLESLRKENLESLETQIREINEEIREMQGAISRRKKD
jgi:archaellum component FlaC